MSLTNLELRSRALVTTSHVPFNRQSERLTTPKFVYDIGSNESCL